MERKDSFKTTAMFQKAGAQQEALSVSLSENSGKQHAHPPTHTVHAHKHTHAEIRSN